MASYHPADDPRRPRFVFAPARLRSKASALPTDHIMASMNTPDSQRSNGDSEHPLTVREDPELDAEKAADKGDTPRDAAPPDAPANERRRLLRQLGPAGILGILWTAAPALCGIALLSYMGVVSDWLQSFAGWGIVVYVGIFIVSAGLGLLPTYAQAILAGWVFGVAAGLPAALLGFLGASLVGYWTAKTVSAHRVEDAIAEHPKAAAVQRALIGGDWFKTFWIITLLRFPPNSPFALTNLALSAGGAPIGPFAAGTLVGMTPRTAVAVIFSASAAASGAKDIQTFVSDGPGPIVLVVGIVIMLIVLAVIGRIANKAIDRFEKEHPEAAATPVERAPDAPEA